MNLKVPGHLLTGIVFCRCGGMLVSCNGYVHVAEDGIRCWKCHDEFDLDDVLGQRAGGRHVVYQPPRSNVIRMTQKTPAMKPGLENLRVVAAAT